MRHNTAPLALAACNDTRGGVQPYVALALGLKKAGHDVRAIAPSDLASMFGEVAVPVAPLSGSIIATVKGSNGAAERGVLASMRLAAHELPRIVRVWTKETLDACAGVEDAHAGSSTWGPTSRGGAGRPRFAAAPKATAENSSQRMAWRERFGVIAARRERACTLK